MTNVNQEEQKSNDKTDEKLTYEKLGIVSTQKITKTVNWYDLIKCNYYRTNYIDSQLNSKYVNSLLNWLKTKIYEQSLKCDVNEKRVILDKNFSKLKRLLASFKYQNSIKCINLPAAFLKEKNILPELEIKTDWLYKFSFDKFTNDKITVTRHNNTIDDFFAKCVNNNKKPTKKMMLSYCRSLFNVDRRTKKNEVSGEYENIHEPNKSSSVDFSKQFDSFIEFFGLSKIWHAEWNKRNTNKKAEIFKNFILYRVAIFRTKNGELSSRPISPKGKYKVQRVQLKNTINDDISTTLYSDDIIQDDLYYKKFYSLLWTKQNIDNSKLLKIIQCIDYIDAWSKVLPNIKLLNDKSSIEILDSMRNPCFTNIKLSVTEYMIVYLYIKNCLKFRKWQVLSAKLVRKYFLYNDNYFENVKPKISKIYELSRITNKQNYRSAMEFFTFNVFKKYLLDFKYNQKKYILDFIFSGNNKQRLRKKIDQLKNNWTSINAIVKCWCSNDILILDTSMGYNFILASFLFFQFKQIRIDSLQKKQFDKNSKDTPIRNYTIQEILKKFKPHGVPMAYIMAVNYAVSLAYELMMKENKAIEECPRQSLYFLNRYPIKFLKKSLQELHKAISTN